MNPKNILSLFIIILIFSCNGKTENSTSEVKTYFDLKEYFVQQAKTLQANTAYLQKKITKDGKVEQKIFNQVDWQKELKPFSDCDINKPAWINSYLMDTVFSNYNTILKYSARETSLPIQQLIVVFENDKLRQLTINKQSANSYYTAKNDYVFVPDSGFTITGSQEVMLAQKTNYSITAKFMVTN